MTLAAVWCCTTAVRASFEFTKPRWDSSTELLELARTKLGRERVVLGAQLDWSNLTAQDAVLMLHPTTRVQFAEVSSFLSAGGRLALVDDFGKGDQLLERFLIYRIAAPDNPLEKLQDNRHLQYARPAGNSGPNGVELTHPMVDDVDYVVTNHPAALATEAGVELTRVLNLADHRGGQYLLAVIGVIGDATACGLDDGQVRTPRARCGRLFAMADPSVFINLMMHFDGNRALANGMIDYLVEDDTWGARQGKLYIVTGNFSQSGQYGDDGSFERQLDSLLDNASDLLQETQEQGLPKNFALALALLAIAATAAWVWRASGKVYHRPTPRYAQPVPLVAQGGLLGRAAVLSAETTSPSLVVLELKTATEAFFRERLGLGAHSSSAEIMSSVQQRGALSPRSIQRLQRAFEQMTQAEATVIGSQTVRFTPESIKDLQSTLQETVEELDRTGRRIP